ncbi:MAG TPA: 50S ribosomal protein L5 [Candidatus Pacearchaeota archaeon]|nr:50S ribosomal protein L5 [Candidatus Pacearchaeota archaeon]HPR80039.1 50S ribosomal protein L5 [Candidatus Pacearchaeota archaeon]
MAITSIKEKYKKIAVPKMKAKFGYKNVMAIPKIEKIVINIGFGRVISPKTKDEQKKFIEYIRTNLSSICGQRPVMTVARKSISTFKLREGSVIGSKVTLRGKKMNDFMEKLVNIVLPRSRDFLGINPKSVDGGGNLNLGIKEHIAFPEISPEKSPIILGMEVTINTNAKSKAEGLELFKLLDFPFKKS